MSTANRRRRLSGRVVEPRSSLRSQSRKRGRPQRSELIFDEGKGLSTAGQQYDPTSLINEVRDARRAVEEPAFLAVAGHAGDGSAPTALADARVQRRAAVFLSGRGGRDRHLAHRSRASLPAREAVRRAPGGREPDANPLLSRLALKLATGAGKTT